MKVSFNLCLATFSLDTLGKFVLIFVWMFPLNDVLIVISGEEFKFTAQYHEAVYLSAFSLLGAHQCCK